MGNTGTPGLRYSVVKTYAVSALEPLPALPTASSNSTSQEGTSEDKQPFTPRTVKNMTEIEGVTKPTRSDYPSPPAKPGLDFISAEIDKANTATLPENADTDEKVAKDDSQLPEDSSVKQSRGKLKLS